MVFYQVAQAKSLREIYGGLASTTGKFRHLGMNDALKKSTLSYANRHRPWEIFRDLFYASLELCKTAAPQKRKFRFKNKLPSQLLNPFLKRLLLLVYRLIDVTNGYISSKLSKCLTYIPTNTIPSAVTIATFPERSKIFLSPLCLSF